MEKVDKKTGEVEMPVNKMSGYNERGEEIPDSRPMALPVGFKRPLPLGQRIRALVQQELLNRELGDKGIETFEEADDFDVPDDPADPCTPFEENFDPDHTTAREQEIRSGAVQDRSAERKAKAKEVIAKAKAAAKVTKADALAAARKVLQDYIDQTEGDKGEPDAPLPAPVK